MTYGRWVQLTIKPLEMGSSDFYIGCVASKGKQNSVNTRTDLKKKPKAKQKKNLKSCIGLLNLKTQPSPPANHKFGGTSWIHYSATNRRLELTTSPQTHQLCCSFPIILSQKALGHSTVFKHCRLLCITQNYGTSDGRPRYFPSAHKRLLSVPCKIQIQTVQCSPLENADHRVTVIQTHESLPLLSIKRPWRQGRWRYLQFPLCDKLDQYEDF